ERLNLNRTRSGSSPVRPVPGHSEPGFLWFRPAPAISFFSHHILGISRFKTRSCARHPVAGVVMTATVNTRNCGSGKELFAVVGIAGGGDVMVEGITGRPRIMNGRT